MEFFKKNKKAVALTLGTTAVLSLIYYYLNNGEEEEGGEEKKDVEQKQQIQNNSQVQEQEQQNQQKDEKVKRSKNTKQVNDEEQQQQTVNQKKPPLGDEKIEGILQSIQNKYKSNNILDFGAIAQILELSIDLAEKQYAEITIENRKQRREIMRTDPDTYEKLILSYNDEVDNVISESQEKILDYLNIQKETFEQSVVQLMESGFYQQVYMLQAAVRQKIKEKIPATKSLNNEQAKEVIKYQVQVLKDNPEFFKRIIQKLQINPETAQMIPLAINTMLQDLIFEKYQVEEEDQMKNMNGQQLIADPEVQPLLIEIEDAMYQLMGQMGMGGMMGGYDQNEMIDQMDQNF